MTKERLGYFFAAGLFALATVLNFYREGLNLLTGIGIVLAGAMLAMALKARGGPG
jgi:hypothetical protein